MKLHKKKRIAAKVLGVGKNKVSFDTSRIEDILSALTKGDIKSLVKQGAIKKKTKSSQSRARARKKIVQKRKGRKQNPGSRKGSSKARKPRKAEWVKKIRRQRNYLTHLKNKELLSTKDYNDLRRKCKGGFFRSVRHIKIYTQERGILKEKNGN